jgi:hypothetical protein
MKPSKKNCSQKNSAGHRFFRLIFRFFFKWIVSVYLIVGEDKRKINYVKNQTNFIFKSIFKAKIFLKLMTLHYQIKFYCS